MRSTDEIAQLPFFSFATTKRKLRSVITPYFLLHCSKESNKEKARQIRTSTRPAIMQEF